MEPVHIPSEIVLRLMDGKPIRFTLNGQVHSGSLHLTWIGRDTYEARIIYPAQDIGGTFKDVEIRLTQQQIETLKWKEEDRLFFAEF